jgi:hypothetical protein
MYMRTAAVREPMLARLFPPLLKKGEKDETELARTRQRGTVERSWQRGTVERSSGNGEP